jgi:hypothetical protein
MMTDIDFDELDRAVSSLNDNKSARQAPEPVIISPTQSVRPMPSPVERPVTGRFMDVVHPSSDMRTNLNMPERAINISKPAPAPAMVPKSTPPVVASKLAQIVYPNIETPPTESPFLSDAKVEKRPLGAFSNDAPTAINAPEIMPDQPSADAPLPAELDDALLMLDTHSTDSPEPPKLLEAVSEGRLSAPTVINQQYNDKSNSDDTSNGAIFDASSYHRPMVRPTKKKSGWLWVVWIILLLIAGVGAGVAAYYFVLPALKLSI